MGMKVEITRVSAAKLVKSHTTCEAVTLTDASTDYPAVTAPPAWAKYVVVYCAAAVKVAMGAATSATNGVWVGAGVPTTFPILLSDTAADNLPHAQTATGGSVVTYTWMRD
jgi:hypothetical protein